MMMKAKFSSLPNGLECARARAEIMACIRHEIVAEGKGSIKLLSLTTRDLFHLCLSVVLCVWPSGRGACMRACEHVICFMYITLRCFMSFLALFLLWAFLVSHSDMLYYSLSLYHPQLLLSALHFSFSTAFRWNAYSVLCERSPY